MKDEATDRENRKYNSYIYVLASRAVNKIRVVRKSTSFRVSSKQYSFTYSTLTSNLLNRLLLETIES